MKKRIVALILISAMAFSLSACGKNEPTVVDEPAIEEAVVEVESDTMDEGQEAEVVVSNPEDNLIDYAHESGFTLAYDSNAFVEDNGGYDDGSLTLRCVLDPEHQVENYCNIQYETEYSADEFYEGLQHQNEGADGAYASEGYWGTQGLQVKMFMYNVTDDFQLSFVIIPANEGAYVVEYGSHIYDDETDLGYMISGAFENLTYSFNFPVE